ncbi:MAG: SprT family zinc-dependent metalloprotease [Candidatus Gastranaerophilales bacterium]|nr:SprT family zinc-dependent metalloprotease [Candidatus Gastranaerophilales bacterium]
MHEKYLEISGVKILFKKSKRAKKLNIKIRPKDGAVVTVPWMLPYDRARDFVESHLDWIRANLTKMEKYKNSLTVFDENTTFTTKNHRLVIEKKLIKKNITSIKEGKIIIKFPLDEDITTQKNQEKIRKSITEAFRIEAKEYLPLRTELLAKRHGLKYKDLTIKNLTSRWGSCSGRNNINLNLHLIRLPYELIDYVILHELAHTKEKNHSKKFWDFLCKMMPDAIELNKKLKFYKIEIF